MTYGWAILVVLCAIGALAYFGVFAPDKYLEDIPEEEAQPTGELKMEYSLDFICNNLMVDENIYPFLKVMGDGLMEQNNADGMIYREEVFVDSDYELLTQTGRIFCSVPVELCFTENNDYAGGSYCMVWRLETPLIHKEWVEWYEGLE